MIDPVRDYNQEHADELRAKFEAATSAGNTAKQASAGEVVENPPAFPRVGEGFGNPRYDAPGMTLRDWFATAALSGWMSSYDASYDHPTHVDETSRENGEHSQIEQNIARWSYAMADAMLRQRGLTAPVGGA